VRPELRRSRLLGLAVVAAVLTADQLTKAWVVASLPQRARIVVVPGLFDLTHVTNPGGVWSVGAGLGGAFRTAVFLALPIAITAFAAWYSWSLPARARVRQAAIALVVGGALGNLADRLFRHPPEVVDFLLAHWRNHFWPAFNVADSAICVGVGILLGASFLEDEKDEAALPPPEAPSASPSQPFASPATPPETRSSP
jgi:signal peptidase II